MHECAMYNHHTVSAVIHTSTFCKCVPTYTTVRTGLLVGIFRWAMLVALIWYN